MYQAHKAQFTMIEREVCSQSTAVTAAFSETQGLQAVTGSLSKSVSETLTATGSELISLLTRPHTTTFTLLS